MIDVIRPMDRDGVIRAIYYGYVRRGDGFVILRDRVVAGRITRTAEGRWIAELDDRPGIAIAKSPDRALELAVMQVEPMASILVAEQESERRRKR